MNFIRDIRKVFNANLITLIAGTVLGFVLPAFLPISQYADIKTFTLYLSLIGIFHFGFVDGVFLKYGGKKVGEIDKIELLSEKRFLFCFQFLIAIFLIIIGAYLHNYIIFAFACSLIPTNMITFYKYVYQALGEFTLYARITYITSLGSMMIQLFLIIMNIKISMFYILSIIILNYLVYLVLEILKPFKVEKKVKWNFDDYKHCFNMGIFLLIGNFSMVIFYSMDRWIVKYFFDVNSFAFYSFAISMMTAVNILTSSLTTTFYPYLTKIKDRERINQIKNILLIIGVMASGSYFVFDFIVKNFIVKYTPSLDIISILFVGFPAIIIVNVLYINLYKIEKRQKKYLVIVLILITTSILTIIMSVFLFHDSKTIAIITTTLFYTWLLYSTYDFKNISMSYKNMVYIFTFIIIYSIIINLFDYLFGFFMYYSIIIVITYIFYRSEAQLVISWLLKERQDDKSN